MSKERSCIWCGLSSDGHANYWHERRPIHLHCLSELSKRDEKEFCTGSATRRHEWRFMKTVKHHGMAGRVWYDKFHCVHCLTTKSKEK